MLSKNDKQDAFLNEGKQQRNQPKYENSTTFMIISFMLYTCWAGKNCQGIRAFVGCTCRSRRD
jgi:hypothetical protein